MRLIPIVVLLLCFLLLLLLGADAARSTSTNAQTVQMWTGQLSTNFDFVTTQLLRLPQLTQLFSDATRTETTIDGEQEVAVISTRMSQILQKKVLALQNARDAMLRAWLASKNTSSSLYSSSFSISCSSVVEDTYPPPAGYARNVSLQKPSCHVVTNETFGADSMVSFEVSVSLDLQSTWTQTVQDDPAVLFQYFASANGVFRTFPALNIADSLDARFSDWYTSAVSARRRAVVIFDPLTTLKDQSAVDALLEGAKSLLSSFSYNDRVGLLIPQYSFDPSQGILCSASTNSSDPLPRATADVLAHLSSSLLTLNSSSAPNLTLARAVDLAYTLLREDPLDFAVDGAQPVIYIFTANGASEGEWRNVEKRVSSTRVFTFGSGHASHNKWLERIACLTDGAYYEIDRNSRQQTVRAAVADSFRLLAPASRSSVSWNPTLGFLPGAIGSGVVLSASLPVIVPQSGEFVGVVGIDFRMNDLQSIVSSTTQKLSYSFLVSPYGDALIHPKLDSGRGFFSTDLVSAPPLYRDVVTYETSANDPNGTAAFKSQVRQPMFEQSTGSASFVIARSTPQGDATFNYIKSRLAPVHYYWKTLEEAPFVVVLSMAEEDLAQIEFDSRRNETVYFIFDQPFFDAYPQYVPAGGWQPYYGPDGYSRLTDLEANMQVGPDYLSFDPNLLFSDQDLCAQLHRYLNDIGPAPSNPGINRRAKTLARLLLPMHDQWKSAVATYRSTFSLNYLYFGMPDSWYVQYPGYLDGEITWYNPSRRPWYQLAVSNPNFNCLTAPYLDVTGFSITTIARTVYDNQNRLMGVIGVDLTYTDLHKFIFSSTGCRLFQNDTTSPKCYLFDESALLTTSFTFYNPVPGGDGQYTPIDNRFLGVDEPELALDLLSKGMLLRVRVRDYSQGPAVENEVFQVNSSFLLSQPSGVASGSILSNCQQGDYFITKVDGTNMYLAVIHNAESLGTTSCPTVPRADSTDVPAEMCYPLNSADDNSVSVAVTSTQLENRRIPNGKCADIPRNIIRTTKTYPGSIIMMALASIGIVVTVFVAVVIWKFLKTPVVQSSNPLFCYATLAGCVLLFASIFPLAMKPSTGTCVSFTVLSAFGAALILSFAAAKMVRILRILSNTTLLAVPITTVDLAYYASGAVVVEAVFLVVWMSGWTLELRLTRKSDNSGTFVETCGCDHLLVFTTIQIVLLGGIALVGCITAFATRHVHSKVVYFEPRWVAWSLYLSLITGTCFVLSRFVARTSPHTQFVLSSLCIIIGTAGALTLIFWAKIHIILLNPKLNESSSVVGMGTSTIDTEFRPDAAHGDY